MGVVPKLESSEFVGYAVGRLKTLGPIVEEACGASFAYRVEREPSDPGWCTGGYDFEVKWDRWQRERGVNDVSFGCRDERAELGSDRLLQSYVCLDCCHESGEVSLELVNQVIDGGGLFRELQLCFHQVFDVGPDEVTEPVEWNAWGLDAVGLVGLLGHRVWAQCTLGEWGEGEGLVPSNSTS